MGAISAESDNEDITATVEGYEVTVEVDASATEGGTVTVSDTEDNECEVVINITNATE